MKIILWFGKTKSYYFLVVLYFIVIGLIRISTLDLGGIRFFTNQSHSMEPFINSGSLTISKRQDYYEPGDIISFYSQTKGNEEIVTHRLLRMGGNVYITKGDANDAIDQQIVLPRLIIGKVLYVLPAIGYFFSFTKTALGWLVAIFIPAFVIITVELAKIVTLLQKKKYF